MVPPPPMGTDSSTYTAPGPRSVIEVVDDRYRRTPLSEPSCVQYAKARFGNDQGAKTGVVPEKQRRGVEA